MTNVPRNDGRCLFNKIANINAKNVWILIPRPGGVEAEDEAERDAEAGEGEDGVPGHEARQRGGRDHAVQVHTLPQVLASAAAARNKPDM